MSSLYILYFIILLSLDNDDLETSKRSAMFYMLSQIFIVKCFTKSLLIRIIIIIIIIITISFLRTVPVEGIFVWFMNMWEKQI